jgi:hypothetical protein
MTDMKVRAVPVRNPAMTAASCPPLRNWFVEINSPSAFNAGKKAFDDVNDILRKAQFRPITIDRDQRALKRILQAPMSMARLTRAFLSADVLILLQAPLPREIKGFITLLLRAKRAKAVILLHDIDSMRYPGRLHEVGDELSFFGSADAVICHNGTMARWLQERGLNVPIVELSFFDYLVSVERTTDADAAEDRLRGNWKREVVFAGSLSRAKSGFIYELPQDYPVTVRVFGAEPSAGAEFPSSVRYCGRFPPDRPTLPKGLFGLVWDGPDTSTCVGSGEYMKINSPHKASLYLACGLPVLCWRGSAIAKEIESRQLGIAVDSLHEVPDALARLTAAAYAGILERVESLQRTLRAGGQLQEALVRVLRAVEGAA